jgi:hypothetical protein
MTTSTSGGTSRPPFPQAIDSTMLASFRSCPQKMFRTYIEHWKPQSESVHLVAGKAFARGVEVGRREFFENGRSPEDSVALAVAALLAEYGDFTCPSESAKSPERMAGALEFYFANYPLGQDSLIPLSFPGGKRGIEFSFCQPLGIDHPVTGQPLLYTGRADAVASFAGGNFIVDEKTATSLGGSWAQQWDLRSQFTGYCWASREIGIKVDGVLVRGVSILKTKYDTQQAVTYRSEYEIDRWVRQVERDIRRMIACWEEGYWDYNLDHACTEYSGCSLRNVCKSPNPETWLPTYFERRVWDPLAREEVTHEQWLAQQP